MVFKGLGMNKFVQVEKRVMPRTEDWNITTFRRRSKNRKSCQRIRENTGDWYGKKQLKRRFEAVG